MLETLTVPDRRKLYAYLEQRRNFNDEKFKLLCLYSDKKIGTGEYECRMHKLVTECPVALPKEKDNARKKWEKYSGLSKYFAVRMFYRIVDKVW